MPNKTLIACLDSNIFISAIGFGGNPLAIVRLALKREFLLVMSPAIIEEVRRNLIEKLGLEVQAVEKLFSDLEDVSTTFVPTGKLKFTGYKPDDAVVEAALMGGADVLVTGDKKHLLPLRKIDSLLIEAPAIFLQRFEK